MIYLSNISFIIHLRALMSLTMRIDRTHDDSDNAVPARAGAQPGREHQGGEVDRILSELRKTIRDSQAGYRPRRGGGHGAQGTATEEG